MNIGSPLPGKAVVGASLQLARAAAIAALVAAVPASNAAEPPPVLKLLEVRAESLQVKAGEPVRIIFDLEPPLRWHLYPAAKQPLLGRQTTFEFDGAEVAGAVVEPRPRIRREAGLESDFHEGKVRIIVPVRLAPGASPGPRDLKGRVVYQICDWNLCLSGQAPFQVRLTVIDAVKSVGPTTR